MKCAWCGQEIAEHSLAWGRNILGEKPTLHDNCFQTVWKIALKTKMNWEFFDQTFQKQRDTQTGEVMNDPKRGTV
jgi:hypothetical protein